MSRHTIDIRKAIDRVFKEYPIQRLPIHFVVNTALYNLKVQPSEFRDLEKRVRKYLAESNKRNGKFRIASGFDGGVEIRQKNQAEQNQIQKDWIWLQSNVKHIRKNNQAAYLKRLAGVLEAAVKSLQVPIA
jgi:hypothetical protein